MISDIKELKELIIWAKSEGIKRLKVGDVDIEISDIAVIEKFAANDSVKGEPLSTSKTLVDTEVPDADEEKELRYWSSRGT